MHERHGEFQAVRDTAVQARHGLRLPPTAALPLLLAALSGHCTHAKPLAHEGMASPATSRIQTDTCQTLSPIYPSKGVHNPCECGPNECVEQRTPTDPPDPRYPDYWVSEWRMFRVFHGFSDNLPPYANPPVDLKEGPDLDYEVSRGASYYDSTYVPHDGDGSGALMEHYEKYCLPIFPIDNRFTCSVISLGNKTYVLTDDEDRPRNMPACCLFSPYSHPPRPDFIKHLPYNAEDSQHVSDSLQAYRYVAKGPGGEDRWFAYAFYRDQWLDPERRYLRPQSYYFSGATTHPPDAPVVSQNYVDFRIERPDPKVSWDQVAAKCPASPPPCQLFDPPSSKAEARLTWNHTNGPKQASP